MKGSPIVATALACLIMLGLYLGMRVAFFKDDPLVVEPKISEPTTSGEVAVYAEIYFSNLPKNFSIAHPGSGKLLLNVTDPDTSEWSGKLMILVGFVSLPNDKDLARRALDSE